MSQVSGKLFVALTAGSLAIAIASSAEATPDRRGAEAARTETQRAAHLRHARAMRDAVRRNHPRPVRMSSKRSSVGWPALVTEARKYIGTNPTAMQRRWCARFLNFVLNKAGYRGTNSDAARSFASYGRRINEPRIGAIAVLSRGKNQNLGHVGIVTGVDANGNPMIISGNHGRRVAESVYPRGRVIAYVMPADGPPMTHVAAAASAGPASPARAHEGGGLTSPIHELLAAINAESPKAKPGEPTSAQVQQQQRVATVQLAAQSRPRAEPQAAAPMPRRPVRPPVQAVPQPRPAPYRLVQQMPSPTPDPRRIVR